MTIWLHNSLASKIKAACMHVFACWCFLLITNNINSLTHTTHNRLTAFVRDYPGGLAPEKNIHPLTPILIIRYPVSTSSIYYDPQHPSCSIYVLDSPFPHQHQQQQCTIHYHAYLAVISFDGCTATSSKWMEMPLGKIGDILHHFFGRLKLTTYFHSRWRYRRHRVTGYHTGSRTDSSICNMHCTQNAQSVKNIYHFIYLLLPPFTAIFL